MTQPHYAICFNCNEEITYFPGDPVICQCCGANYGVMQPTMNEYCPKCGDTLEVSDEFDRLCERCGWFGDTVETASAPALDAEESAHDAILLYRDLCRNELILEQAMEQGKLSWDDMAKARVTVADGLKNLLQIFQSRREEE